ncbi:hypothetical protein [Mannheimia granulomatis]|uniref:hypothetical protein n=1 Tax=Mannheimia granulomatis TaxID=85402 RepID=UPI00047E7F75|nr:hypothetical protein [Mannheimia granulomatis]QLB18576.1 hypothetical protein A6B41_03475 [Mannheimia granulomatis]
MKLNSLLLGVGLLLSACSSNTPYHYTAPTPAQSQVEIENVRKQLEKESADREAYYASPQGQTALARQQMIAQQRAIQQQIAAQHRQMYEAQQWNQLNQQLQNINQSIQMNRPRHTNCYRAYNNITCHSY